MKRNSIDKLKNAFGLLIDREDEHFLFENGFHMTCGYLASRFKKKDGNYGIRYLHNFILPKKQGFEVDHINGNKLDNRRSNLRYASHSENMRNTKFAKNNTSGYRGVYWHEKARKWMASIGNNGKSIYLGLFKDRCLAYSVFLDAQRKLHGEFSGPTSPNSL